MNDRAAAASDEELALEARAGSRRSFEELAVRYGRKLSAFLGPKIASRQDVEDVIQQTLLNLFRHIDRYDPRWKFSTWAYTAANRLAITHYRKLAKAKKLETAAAEMPAAASDHSAETSGANLWATARALPPAQYQALWLFYAEEMSIREVTRVMNKSSIAVRSLLHRGRLSLADLMGGAGHAAAHALTGPRRGKVVCFKENSG
jgi:RNA polymerase sigma-70 factor (ECF subfamily)